MSRSGYTDDCENLGLWRGAVDAAIFGKRGQQFMRDLVTALDAIPSKRLIAGELECEGEVCALGSVGKLRDINMIALDPYDQKTVAEKFGIARALACEIMFENDEGICGTETPEQRWKRVRKWALSNIVKEAPCQS